jgi:hypothetical protein
LSIARRFVQFPGFSANSLAFLCFSQLNLQVQEVGTYFQYSIFQLNFWTDAFGQLREGSGRAVDDKSAHYYTDWFNFAQLWWYEDIDNADGLEEMLCFLT